VTKKQLVELTAARHLLLTGEARRVRLANHLSQAELAAQIGVSPAAVSRWESGTRRPVGRPAIAYANFLCALQVVRAMEIDSMPRQLAETSEAASA
jgi:transcriptional regulator with XRE-family HTH domain